MPTDGFSLEELTSGAIELSSAESVRVGGQPLEQGSWHRVVVGDYVLNTLLKNMPERESGFRDLHAVGTGEREAVRQFLSRGEQLRT